MYAGCGVLQSLKDLYLLVRTCKEGEPSRIAEHIEKFIYEDLKEKIKIEKFMPYIQMHEFEALLFSNVDCFDKCKGIKNKMISLKASDINIKLSAKPDKKWCIDGEKFDYDGKEYDIKVACQMKFLAPKELQQPELFK